MLIIADEIVAINLNSIDFDSELVLCLIVSVELEVLKIKFGYMCYISVVCCLDFEIESCNLLACFL